MDNAEADAIADDYMPKLATGYAALASYLREFVYHFNPWGGTDSVGTVAHVPIFLADDAESFFTAYRNGTLDTVLEATKEPWFVQAAIKEYFTKEHYEEHRRYLSDILDE